MSRVTYRGRRVGDRLIVSKIAGESLRLVTPRKSQRLHFHARGFDWGYSGAGAEQLALALLFDATGDPRLSRRWSNPFMYAIVRQWGDEWSITAADVRRWVEHECGREAWQEVAAVRRCRKCGCTDDDCRQCIAAQGFPCSWAEDEPDLCTRCAMEEDDAITRDMEGGAS